MSDLTFYSLVAGFVVVYLLWMIVVVRERTRPPVTRRDPEWFTDQHRDARNAHIRSFQDKAAKGLSEESKTRAHLTAVSKTGTRP